MVCHTSHFHDRYVNVGTLWVNASATLADQSQTWRARVDMRYSVYLRALKS